MPVLLCIIFLPPGDRFLWIIREGELQRGDEEVFQHGWKSKVILTSWRVCSAASKKTAISGENENFDKTMIYWGIEIKKTKPFVFLFPCFLFFLCSFAWKILHKRKMSYCAGWSV